MGDSLFLPFAFASQRHRSLLSTSQEMLFLYRVHHNLRICLPPSSKYILITFCQTGALSCA